MGEGDLFEGGSPNHSPAFLPSVERENGMRFPGRVLIEGHRYRINSPREKKAYRAIPIFRVEQLYTNYRFFSIRTAEEIKRIVLGNQGLVKD